MIQKIRNNLAIKLSLIFVIAQILVLGGFGAYLYLRYSEFQRDERIRLASIPSQLINAGFLSLEIVDHPDTLAKLTGFPVHSAFVVDMTGIIIHATDGNCVGSTIESCGMPGVDMFEDTTGNQITFDDHGCSVVVSRMPPRGTDATHILYVEVDNTPDAAIMQQVRRIAYFGILISLVAYGVFLYYTLRHTFFNPVNALLHVFEHAEKGNLAVRSKVGKHQDAIGMLQRRTNALLIAQERSHGDIEHLNRVLRALRDVNQLIAMQYDRIELIEAVCDHLVSSGSYDCAWIGLLTPEGVVERLQMASIQTDPQNSEVTEIELMTCIQEIAYEHEQVIVLDPHRPQCSVCPGALAGGCKQTMAVRLRYGDTVFGVISASVPLAYSIDLQEMSLFEAVADDVAYGLFNIQNEKERLAAVDDLAQTQSQWQHVVDTMPVMLDAFDENGLIIAWNDACERVTGYCAEEMIGNPHALDLLYPDPVYRSQVLASIEDPSRREFALNREWTLITKSGEKRIVDWYNGSNYAPLPMWHHWAVGIDVTDRVHAEQALRQSDRHVASMLQNPVGYVVFRLAIRTSPFDFDAILVSPSVLDVLGVEPDSADIVTTVLRNIHEDDKPLLRRGYITGMHPPYILDMELRYYHPSKGLRWLHIRASGVRDADESPLSYSNGVVMDITERVETAQALRRSNRHIESLLNNPVGYVMFRLQLGEKMQESRLVLVSPSVGDVAGVVPCEEDSIITWLRFVHPDDQPLLMQAFARAMKPPHSFDLELRYLHPNKGLRWMHIQASGVFEDDSELPVYANGILMDITERKLVEDQMRESVERLRQAEIAAQSGFWSQDPTTGIEWWSENQYRLHGIDPSEGIRPTFELHMSCLYPDDRQLFMDRRQDDLAGTATLIEDEFRMLLPNGDVRHIRARAHVERDMDGTALRILGMDQDVTERKINEQRLDELLERVSQQAQQMQQVMNTVPDGIALLDYNLSLQLANPAATAILEEVCGLQHGDVIDQIAGVPIDELLKKPRQPGAWHEAYYHNRTLEILTRPVTSSGEQRAWVLALRDVTAERTAQRYAMQQERLASVGQLAAGIAHDFNNIMAVIILYAGSLLMSRDLAEDARERLQTINGQARAATTLIQQILDFSRRSALERRPMDLVPFLKEQRLLFQRTLPESIDVELNHGREDYVVNADPTSLQQVMMNLAVNARDAMPNGGTLLIDLSAVTNAQVQAAIPTDTHSERWVCITVRDTGYGMPQDIMSHLFEPFHTTKEPGKGSGLGLAQVHGIIKQHEGEITVESELDNGTAFRIYLPLLAVPQSDPQAPGEDQLMTGNGETVLVVEDNPVMRTSLVESLTLLNYRSLEAGNGHEALFMLSRHTGEVDLVLSDVVMPSMGGIDLFEAIQEQALGIPVVLLTGHPLGGEIDGLIEKGLRAWMTKPPSLAGLAQMLYEAIHTS